VPEAGTDLADVDAGWSSPIAAPVDLPAPGAAPCRQEEPAPGAALDEPAPAAAPPAAGAATATGAAAETPNFSSISLMSCEISRTVILGTVAVTLVTAACHFAPAQPTAAPMVRPARLVVHFIDVGQGDATLITASSGERLLIDGGRSRPLVRERLRALGVTDLDAVVATHADADHLAGLLEVLDLYQVKRIYYHAELRTTATYHSFVRAAQAEVKGAQARTHQAHAATSSVAAIREV